MPSKNTACEHQPWKIPMFAYGVNTNIEHLLYRCPAWNQQWKPATLPDHEMRFNKVYPRSPVSFCNIKRTPGSQTYGVMLWLDAASFDAIDRYEGYPIHYDRKLVTAICDDQPLRCWVYWSRHRNNRRAPHDTYLRNVMRGLIEFAQAPDHYVQELLESLPLPTPMAGHAGPELLLSMLECRRTF